MWISSTICLLMIVVSALSAGAQFHNAHAHQALFIRDIDAPSPYNDHPVRFNYFEHTSDRLPRQSAASTVAPTTNMDQTVQGILEWLQGKYANGRKARQESPAKQYLPSRVAPTTTQRPRPFQPNNDDLRSTFIGNDEGSNNAPGYPYPQPPNPTFNIPETPFPYSPSPTGTTAAPYSPSSTGGTISPYGSSSGSLAPYNPSSPSPSPGSSQQPYNPSPSPQSPFSPQLPYNQPSSSQAPYNPPSSPQTPYNTPSSPQAPYNPPSSPQSPYNVPSSSFPSGEPNPSQIPFNPSPGTGYPNTGVGFPSSPGTPTGPAAMGFLPVDNTIDSGSHPPHIHQINVQCAKDMMTIDIEFDRPFNGIIYSKGHYNSPGCRYVNPNSGQIRYSFTVQLNSCGTQFIDQFSEGKQAYLENVLVLQNEAGIQEVGVAPPALRPVWDTIRSVRCLWEGSLNKAVSVALSVGMLSQEIVTFSGDTATAKLDIQLGRGPFAAAANGLVKIGETMTLVVTVEGDPGFNILVRQCVARDSDPSSGNVVQLTDDRGCVVKPKLMGAFQTTRNPDTNAVIAYAFFHAFKFPDVMDLTIECNVELCKTECAPCSDSNQKLEPGRRRRSVDNATVELTDPVTVGRRLRVFLPEDLEQTGPAPSMIINVGSSVASPDSVCLSTSVFLFSSGLLLTLLSSSCICSAVLWLRMQHHTLRK